MLTTKTQERTQKSFRTASVALLSCLMLCGVFAQEGGQEGHEEGWWMKEPIRWVQTNLRQVDATLDARRLAEQLAEMRADVALMGMGGIVSYYPTSTQYHYASPDLPAGRDMFGDVLCECHARKIRVFSRHFDHGVAPTSISSNNRFVSDSRRQCDAA
jgi:hypothetical protein